MAQSLERGADPLSALRVRHAAAGRFETLIDEEIDEAKAMSSRGVSAERVYETIIAQGCTSM